MRPFYSLSTNSFEKLDGEAGIFTGSFQDKGDCIADESVSLVFTDPPYDMAIACTRWGKIL
jgi:DNA modification methylase